MHLDWVTVSAQIVNFLILVWLLQRFLYKPVLRAMDLRERRIRERVRDADRAAEAAEKLRLEFETREKLLEEERTRILAQAREEMERQRPILMAQLRDEIAQKRSVWEAESAREREAFLENLKTRLGVEAMAVARRALKDLADTRLEHQVARVFLDRIERAAAEIRSQAAKAGRQWRIVSAFEMDPATREMVTARLAQVLPGSGTIDFECKPELICGMALRMGGNQWGWSVAGYLQELEREVMEALSRGAPAAREMDVAS